MANQTKKQTLAPKTCYSAAGSPRHQGEKSTLPQGVTALQTWLEDHGWEVSIECPFGEAYAKIERVSKRGIGFVTCTKMTPQSYREMVEGIDPNEEVLEIWQSNEDYRAVMGNLATAWNDINEMKELLLTQLKTLKV